MRRLIAASVALAVACAGMTMAAGPETQPLDRWTLLKDGGIGWEVAGDARLPHSDHVEMSGRMASVILTYGVDAKGELQLSRLVAWPTLRTIPNNTHATLMKTWETEVAPVVTVDGRAMGALKPYRMEMNGALTVWSHTDSGVDVERIVFAPRDARAEMEEWIVTVPAQEQGKEARHDVRVEPLLKTEYGRGTEGIYVEAAATSGVPDGGLKAMLGNGESVTFGMTLSGRRIMEPRETWDVAKELAGRMAFVEGLRKKLVLETPDAILNREFDFAKLRAAESIFETKSGLLHSPGGGRYYAAVWCNDQVEYAGPFFAFLGDAAADEASLNAYKLYMPFMGPEYKKIPSSIISEGLDIWEGAGDRGDAAMYAYGASRFALARGDRNIAEELYPAIAWCLEYCKRQMTDDGVINSKTDELEGRFTTNGKPNLSTSMLTFGGLRSGADVARALGKNDDAVEYDKRADALAAAIEKHFGADLEGFHTYRYNDGNDKLRSWICLPLTLGIMDRKDGTIDALFSPRLWTIDGVATQADDKTFWDRSTLYAFRGAFNAGATERVMPYLTAYTRRRLLGDHVPYPVEAYPEGEQRHLSAESALFCRVITEGLFGMKPTGLNSFTLMPRLPEAWPSMTLHDIHAFGRDFDIVVKRDGGKVRAMVTAGNATVADQVVEDGKPLDVTLP